MVLEAPQLKHSKPLLSTRTLCKPGGGQHDRQTENRCRTARVHGHQTSSKFWNAAKISKFRLGRKWKSRNVLMPSSQTCWLIQSVWTKHASSWIGVGLEPALSCWVFPLLFSTTISAQRMREIVIFACKYSYIIIIIILQSMNGEPIAAKPFVCTKTTDSARECSVGSWGHISASFHHFRNFTIWMLVHTSQRNYT